MVSCKENKASKAISGWWSIDTVIYQGYDLKYCANNSITFDKNTVMLSTTHHRCPEIIETWDENGIWDLYAKEDSIQLKINTKNRMFNGTYNIQFYKDPKKKLLKMKITSDSIYIICRKGMFCYDCEKSLVNDLTK